MVVECECGGEMINGGHVHQPQVGLRHPGRCLDAGCHDDGVVLGGLQGAYSLVDVGGQSTARLTPGLNTGHLQQTCQHVRGELKALKRGNKI